MDPEDEQSLEERLRAQMNNNINKTLTTRVTTTTTTTTLKSNRQTFKDGKIQTHTDKHGVCYRIGDHVYLETNKQSEPYSIASILDFRLTRKDHVMLEVCWYYRPAEIPANLYHILIEDRYHENQGNNQTSPIKDKQTQDFSIIQDPNIIARELFVSEIKEFYPAVHIKGRCRVAHYQDIEEARAFKPDPDTFFYILTYNPEARRLANTQGEIRVGSSHQAKLPLLKVLSNTNDDPCSLREELLWKNKTSDIDLSMYLQAARSIAAFAGMCDRGLPEDMYDVAQRDDTTINALTILHNNEYDCKRAIQALVKCPIPKGIDRKWPEDDQKKFLKGLRQYGKNFFRIRKEHLPHKETSDLVEYYYLWKKTPQAQSNRPRRRQRPCSTSVNLSTTPTPTKQRNTKTNNKDDIEHNSDNDDNTTTDSDEQYCRHCQTISKDLQTGGRDSQFLCYDCRMYYKKYGEMPILNQELASYLFQPLNETSPSCSKRKRNRLGQSDENNSSIKSSSSSSSTRSKKRLRVNEQISSIKQEDDEEEELTIKTEIKLEEQENEKPLINHSLSTNSSFLIKTEDLNIHSSTLSQPLPPLIITPTPFKHELNSPSSISPKITNKILIDHAKQNNNNFMLSPSSTIKSEPMNPNLLLSSPSSAFSRTLKKSLTPKNFEDIDSSLSKSDEIPKDNEITEINDDGNISDSNELICDEGPKPITCERECYNKSQGIVLLQVYDRSISQNTCARTDIILKRGSRTRRKKTSSTSNEQLSSTINVKQEERNSSKLPFSLEKGLSMLHPSGASSLLPFSHNDPLFMNRNSSLFHPLQSHGLGGGPKPPLGFPMPFGPTLHDNPAFRHLDPLGLRLMNPAMAAAQAQFFAAQSSFNTGIGRPTPPGLEPATAAFLLDPRYRGMAPPFSNPSPSSNNSSATNNGTHNHAHIHSHSHTHLHLNNNNDLSSPSNGSNGPSLPPPPPPPLMPFSNPLSGFPHGNPMLYPGLSMPSPSSLEAMHNLSRERELMAFMLANNSRFDPMALAFANSFQMPRHEDLARMNARERSLREHSENELRRFNLDIERQQQQQQQQLRFAFHHPGDELLRRF